MTKSTKITLLVAVVLIVALMGTWRYYITMGLCFAIGVMISDELPEEDEKKERH